MTNMTDSEATLYREIGRQLKEARLKLGFRQADVGRRMTPPVLSPTISGYEGGKLTISRVRLKELARILQLPEDFDQMVPAGRYPSFRKNSLWSKRDAVAIATIKAAEGDVIPSAVEIQRPIRPRPVQRRSRPATRREGRSALRREGDAEALSMGQRIDTLMRVFSGLSKPECEKLVAVVQLIAE